jgi:Serine/threonine protein phosphatase
MGNYRLCGYSQQGKSHEDKNTVCQDAYYYLERPAFVVAAVADGLGSSKHSDIASKMAAQDAVTYCAQNIHKGMSENEILPVIQSAFDNVNFLIKQKAGDLLDEYDTTLTLAVFMSGDVYFGHAGDSGIIALRNDGLFDQVTEPQLGDGYGKERPVYPLAAESHWVFGKYKNRVRAIFMMTDGIWNKAVPPLLERQKYKMDHAYLFYLYDSLRKNRDLANWIQNEFAQILPQEINYDDKTLVCIECTKIKLRLQRKQYYMFPSGNLWKNLLNDHQNDLCSSISDSVQPETQTENSKTINRSNNILYRCTSFFSRIINSLRHTR